MIDQNGTGQLSKSSRKDDELSFYWQQYGLKRDPFSVVADPTIYFPLLEWEHHLDLVQHLIKNENALLAIIGVEGQGKTTFANQVSQLFDESFQLHRFDADSLYSTRKLVRELELGFQLKVMPNESPDEQLDAQIAEVQHKEKMCLLIIDDAHFLPLETINSLIFLLKQQSKNQMKLHIILFGDKNLQAKLANVARLEMSSNIIHTIELAPLTLEETEQYLYYRLNKAGLEHDIPFSQMHIEKIYANSNGIPDKINYFAQQVLLDKLTKQKKLATSSMFKQHQTKIIGGCLLVIVLITASYVLDRQGQVSSPTIQQPVISFAEQSQTVAPPTQQASPQQTNAVNTDQQDLTDGSNNLTANNTTTDSTAGTVAENSANANTQQSATSTTSEIQNNTVANNTTNNESDINSQANVAASAVPATAPVPAQQTNTQATEPTASTNIQNVAQQQATTQPSELPSVASQSKKLMKKNVILKTPKVPALSKSKSTQIVKKATLGHNANIATNQNANDFKVKTGEGRFINQNGKYYTLQVLGLSNEKLMLNFIQQNHLQGDTHYIQTSLNGKPWFILIYGIYKTEQEAVSAVHSLPSALQKYRPWPRTIASVKNDVDKG